MHFHLGTVFSPDDIWIGLDTYMKIREIRKFHIIDQNILHHSLIWNLGSHTDEDDHIYICIYIYIYIYIIQVKICAEYRDMLPRPRLFFQEPGLRPIGRSPGVPDKSSRGLGSMSRYSVQILICFIAYIFQIFFIPLWVWLGTLQDCQYAQCPLPMSIVIRMRLVIRQSKLPACLAEVQLGLQTLSGM